MHNPNSFAPQNAAVDDGAMKNSLDQLDNVLGHDLAVALVSAPTQPRGLSQLVFRSCWQVRSGAEPAIRRARTYESWNDDQRDSALSRLNSVLEETWPSGCTAESLFAATHRHLGELHGELSLSKCRVKEDDPSFTKPIHAFWTCPVMEGIGPVGFEALIQELHPGRVYASWNLVMEPCRVTIIDSASDWAELVAITGPDLSHEVPSPLWRELPFDAVHVTNRAIIDSFTPGATQLWDWGMEQTAWFAPQGSYERRSATETWETAVARLTGEKV